MAARRNLIVSPVGDQSLHPAWLSGADRRDFDLALIYFGEQADRYRGDADYYLQRRGFKFHLFDAMLTQLGSRLDEYDYIWCPDDDLDTCTSDINRLFAITRDYRLSIAQPAIASGDVSFATVRQQPGLLLRYSRFVEVMCPVFSRAALTRIRPTLLVNKSAWGLDWAWTRLVPIDELAIIDAVGVHHTRPLHRGGGYDRMRAAGVDPMGDLRRLASQYGVSRRHRRRIKHGTLRVPAIAMDGTPTWFGPRWWHRVAAAVARGSVQRAGSTERARAGLKRLLGAANACAGARAPSAPAFQTARRHAVPPVSPAP